MSEGGFAAEHPQQNNSPFAKLGDKEILADDPEVRKWERYKEFFAQHERQAHVAIRWLRAMESTITMPTDAPFEQWSAQEELIEKMMDTHLQGVSPEVGNALKDTRTSWRSCQQRAESVLRAIAPDAPTDPLSWTREQEKQIGRMMYEHAVHVPPDGEVRLQQKGPFYFFVFENDIDFIIFKEKALGQYFRQEGGYFAAHVNWTHGVVPTIAIRHGEADEELLAHESEHFVHHALGNLFAGWEGEGEKPKSLAYFLQNAFNLERPDVKKEVTSMMRGPVIRTVERAVKDELLAYIREGLRGTSILKVLRDDDLYQNLYNNLTEDETASLKRNLTGICDALLGHPWTSIDVPQFKMHFRELMTASLLDVPIPKMEKFIRLSGRYYSERLKAVPRWPRTPANDADEATKRAWHDATNAYRAAYNEALGMIPEYGYPSLEEEVLRPLKPDIWFELEDPGPDAMPEQRQHYEEEVKEREELKRPYETWKKQPAQRRRIDMLS